MSSSHSESPNLRGRRIYIPAADHPHADKEGVVVDQEPCELCKLNFTGDPDCGYEDLIVRLDDGTITRVYEPEADLV